MSESELQLFKWCQQTIDINTVDTKLIPSTDEHGLLRAHGRLENIRSLHMSILPKRHQMVNLLLKHLHEKRVHCGYKSHRL